MHYIVLLSLLAACVLADEDQHYSFSEAVGTGGGSAYSLTGEGRIKAVRVWDSSSYIYGIQFKYGDIWSETIGTTTSYLQELELYDDEFIVQLYGKYSSYVHQLMFVTSRGRTLYSGSPSGNTFNMAPSFDGAELRFISGTITSSRLGSIAAHWGKVPENSDESGH